jgi:magnesium-transporting ATPase (P-type)
LQHLGQVLLLFGRQAAQHFRAGTQNKTGPNRLAEKAPRSTWIKLLDQFRSFLVLVLLGATVLAGVVGDLKNAVVIGIVVIFFPFGSAVAEGAVVGIIGSARATGGLDTYSKSLTCNQWFKKLSNN